MANRNDKVVGNVAGVFYVDVSCIDCDACRSVAPDHFALNEDAGLTYVTQQPATMEEYELCVEAMQSCPTDSIGDDGDESESPAADPRLRATTNQLNG